MCMCYLAVVGSAGGGGGGGGRRAARHRCGGAGVGPGPSGPEPSWSPRWVEPSGWAHCGTRPGPPHPPRPEGGHGPAEGTGPAGGPGPAERTEVKSEMHFSQVTTRGIAFKNPTQPIKPFPQWPLMELQPKTSHCSQSIFPTIEI